MEQTTPHEIQLLSVIAEHIGAAGVIALALIWGLFRALQEYLKYKKAKAELLREERIDRDLANAESAKEPSLQTASPHDHAKMEADRTEMEAALDEALLLLAERQNSIKELRARVESLSQLLNKTAEHETNTKDETNQRENQTKIPYAIPPEDK